MQKKFASSTDVARLAGVSQSTVSRAMRGDPAVTEATKRRVMRAASDLGYRPSLLPQIMLTQRSHLVAVVVGGAHNPYYTEVVGRLAQRLQRLACQMLLVQADGDDMLDGVVPRLSGYRVDAVISALPILSADVAAQLASLNIPVIAFNTANPPGQIQSVGGNNRDAGRQIAAHLLDQGGQRFAFLGGPARNPTNAARREGYVSALAEAGHQPRIHEAEFSYEGGVQLAREAFAPGSTPPDAVFCANDLIAIGLIDTLRRQPGLMRPERLRLVGYDDIPQTAWQPYQLSSFRQETDRILDHAIATLERHYQTGNSGLQGEALFRGALVARASSLEGLQLGA